MDTRCVIDRSSVFCFGLLATLVLGGCMHQPSVQQLPLALSGSAMVPPVATNASGTSQIRAYFNRMIGGSITVSGINATAASIHVAPSDQNGPVVLALTRTGDNTFTLAPTALTQLQYEDFHAGHYYVSVASSTHPNGELRGQLVPTPPYIVATDRSDWSH